MAETMLQVCADSMPERNQQPPAHLIPPDEAIKLLRDELKWAEIFTPKTLVNSHMVTEIANKIRVLISGKKYRTPDPRNLVVSDSIEPLNIIPMQITTGAYRKKLLARGNCKCVFCGCKLNNKNSNIDHIYPVSRGGKNIPSNMVLTCERCNSTKGSRTLEEWAADILAVQK